MQRFFAVGTSGLPSSIVLAAIAPAAPGGTLQFVSTSAIVKGMSVTALGGTSISAGTVVDTTPTPTSTGISVQLKPALAGAVAVGDYFVFTPNISGADAGPPQLPAPTTDWLSKCLSAYGAFTLGQGFDSTKLQAAAVTVFPGDPRAQDWLVNALITIDALWKIVESISAPPSSAIQFSILETLYARGVTSAAEVTELSSTAFQQALVGTVAYDFASAIYTAATAIAKPKSVTSPATPGFQPINDGSLVNCIPVPSASPLSPIAYLQEMLTLSELSTCELVTAPTIAHTTKSGGTNGDTLTFDATTGVLRGMLASAAGGSIPSGTGVICVTSSSVQLNQSVSVPGGTTITFSAPILGAVISQRRGLIGNLAVTSANLETPLPLIDIVNERLEYLGAAQSPTTWKAYNTSADQLAGYALCKRDNSTNDRACHEPALIFGALPEYSTPATPEATNQSVEPLVYNNLKIDFSSCHLPYSQALDVSRTYLRYFGSSRFEELRTFRKCITEFVLQPDNPPKDFQSFLWRYAVRIEAAIEYLGITPEEYQLLFQGAPAQPCVKSDDQVPRQTPGVPVQELYGYSSAQDQDNWASEVLNLSEFLARTCLSYCEFLELSKCGFIQISPSSDGKSGAFPECEPCCLKAYTLHLPDKVPRDQALHELAIFIRLWRKLKDVHGAAYSFDQLADICTVLNLFSSTSTNPNPQFIRQLVAFQMLRNEFNLPLIDANDQTLGATGPNRTHLLALWGGSGAKKWKWAVDRLLEGIDSHAVRRFGCQRPHHEDIAHIADNLDALSRLAGFSPPTATNPSTDTWNFNPTCTLRFAEVLAKIRASRFRVEELLYLFNAEPPEGSEDLLEEQDPEDALNYPLELPENDEHHSLWKLREALLAVEVSETEEREWTWPLLLDEFRARFGYVPPSGQDPLLSIGQHFFPNVLEASGFSVSVQQRQYRTNLTSSTAWNSPGSPFRYDATPGGSELWIQLPLRDEAVTAQLSQLPELKPAEQVAVQDLYFAPRTDLAFVALLFSDWQSAEKHLIQEGDEDRRWHYFRHHFALANARRRLIAQHLARHVQDRTGCHHEDLEGVAALVLSQLLADENKGAPWERDNGEPPKVTWSPLPSGGAIAALLGLVGTGLLGEYEIAQTQNTSDTAKAAGATESNYQVVWREVRGPMEGFGHERDGTNSPVPTVLPSLSLSLNSNAQLSIHNGYIVQNSDGRRLGGAEAFRVRWSGALLVECEGEYAFHAGAPTPEGEKPDFGKAEKCQWRVTLKRGQRTFTILNHQWPADAEHERSVPRLRRGAYQIAIEFNEPAPDFTSNSHMHPQHTGFQVKYAGPDTRDCLISLPVKHLYRDFDDHTLDNNIQFLEKSTGAQAFLKAFYTTTLRDIRRTYRRAFKAVLLCGKFGLSARPIAEYGQSELGYILANPQQFAGFAYYRVSNNEPAPGSSDFSTHCAFFDFNFLPLRDVFHSPAPATPDRAHPSLQRTQAIFDWWERIFDYDVIRKEIYQRCKTHLWLLFQEAQLKQPNDLGELLRHIGVDSTNSSLDLRLYQDQDAALYSVTSDDLKNDERWLERVWHADQWVRRFLQPFHPTDISQARPDLWASLDPSASMTKSGVCETGNAKLLAFLLSGCIGREPRRYQDVKRLSDGLRERGRDALLHYLCRMNRVSLGAFEAGKSATLPDHISNLLLLDVQTGTTERATRIDEAITAVQTFIHRARLELEPNWKVTSEFARLWDSRFETYRVWEQSKRRELYKENWVEWSELEKARRTEAFRLLESQLRSSTLSMAAPGGLDWWPDGDRYPATPELLQSRDPSELLPLSPPPQSTTREGLYVLGNPEHAAEPTWVASVPQFTVSSTSQLPPQPNPPPSNGPQIARALVNAAATNNTLPALPLWMESAIKMGTRFWRVAAAGVPPAASRFEPHENHGEKNCVACCEECGCAHPAVVDEYYFWLIDGELYEPPVTPTPVGFQPPPPGNYQYGYLVDFYDLTQQQAALWQDQTQLPQLLHWQGSPTVRLAWSRVHNGHFKQPRYSVFGVAITADQQADLSFLGRIEDSLTFSVSNAVTAGGGFRYDLATDDAIILPQLSAPQEQPPTFLQTLTAYPFFLYVSRGTHPLPLSPFSSALAVGRALRSHCRYEAALKWYRLPFDPLCRDCTWMNCPESITDAAAPTHEQIAQEAYHIWEEHGRPPAEQNQDWLEAETELEQHSLATRVTVGGQNASAACCDSTDISCDQARDRAVLLQYLETLVEWGDAIRRRGYSPEVLQQARVIFDTAKLILGSAPLQVRMPEPTTSQTVSTFKPAFAPLNPRLLALYAVVEDRFELIRNDINSRRLREVSFGRKRPYFGDDPLREGWRTNFEPCEEETKWCRLPSPYRFTFLIQKAQEYAAKVEQLGGALLGAFEKGDAEYLASLRAGQELELLTLGLEAKKDQWRDADWQIQALQSGKSVSQANWNYYNALINAGPGGLIDGEIQYQDLIASALSLLGNVNTTEWTAEAMLLVPDFEFGGAGAGGSPYAVSRLPLGTKLGQATEIVGRILGNSAGINSMTAQLDQTNASWQRRLDEWTHQTQVLAIEIQQIERQIIGAQRRRHQALTELNVQRRQIEHSREVLNFLGDKFTAHDLYLFLQKETLALYHQTYDLALHAARQAQYAFNLERGYTTRHFVPECNWDSLHDGLMAGERLSTALRHMEKAYLDENVREYELTKNFSLRLHFPMEYLRLRTTGRCEIDIPEWMFDVDYAGHFMRRIKNFALTIPCLIGPYNGVHCRLTLLSSSTRIDPRLSAPVHECCYPQKRCSGPCREQGSLAREYEACPDDPRIVREFGAQEAIATSTGQNDSGLFELNFRDERYLPWEFRGAVCRLRIELPPENNYFDLETVSDLILRLNYTAREGGELLRRAANEAARRRVPGDGWRFFDVRNEFPDAWQLFRDSLKDDRSESRLTLRLERRMFAFVPGHRKIRVDKMALLFGLYEDEDRREPESKGWSGNEGASRFHLVELMHGHHEREDALDVVCMASEEWPHLYCGIFDSHVGTLDGRERCKEVAFRFSEGAAEVERVFLLCHYALDEDLNHSHRVHDENRGGAHLRLTDR